MKKLLLLIVILLSVSNFLSAQTCPSANSWNRKADNLQRNQAFSFTIGNKAYIGGGEYSTNSQFLSGVCRYRNDFWEYDPINNVWTQKADLLSYYYTANNYSGLFAATGFSVTGKGYVLGGRTRNNSGTVVFAELFCQYDPNTNSWSDKTPAVVGTDLRWSSQNATFTINNIAYVGSGESKTSNAPGTYPTSGPYTTKWYKYDESSNSFIGIASFNGDVYYYPVGFSANGNGYLMNYRKLYKYDPNANSWSWTGLSHPNTGTADYNYFAFSIGNYGYIGGGINNAGSADYNVFYEYNAVNNSWGSNISFPGWAGINGATGFSIGNRGYVTGGNSKVNAYQINPQLWEFTPSGTQKTIITYSPSLTTLCKGSTTSVYYATGCSGSNYASDNVFTAYLSDVNGFFSNNPVSIGSITSSATSGSISITIPDNTTAGTKYRIRVNSSSQPTIGYDNGTNITINAPGSAGTISHPYSVPYPSELASDQIASSAAASGVSSYLWQSSTDNSSWTTIPNAIGSTYTLNGTNQNDIYFRRGASLACLATVYTPSVLLRVYSASNNRLNGAISGTVRSNNGVGVYGITITAQKNVGLSGSPQSKTYTTTTDQTGQYSIPNIFYGDLNNGDPNGVTFTITPSKSGHTFTPATNTATLSLSIPSVGSKDFTDLATYSVVGKVTQTCANCEVGFQTDSLNGVQLGVTKNGVILPSSTTGASVYGRYANTFTDPGTYKFTPSKTGHRFNPAQQDVTISNTDVSGINFADTTQYTISGVLRAGANEIIGSAQLEFTDTVAGRTTKFKKIVNTAADGSFSVTLPARKYKMYMNIFTPTGMGNDIAVNDLLTWFNTTLKDSSYINIDTSNQTFNLTYHRAPVLVIDNLPDTSCGNYIVFKQDEAKRFTVKVYEGNTLHNCLLSYDSASTVKINTNVHVKDVNQILSYTPVNGLAQVQLLGGSPNIVAPFDKFFNVNYTDRYNRVATNLSRNVKVLGLTADPGTFTTVSPSVPILILHAPPGDQSTSFWEQTQTTETAMRFSALTDKTTGAFADVKIGASFETGIGFVTESSVWANVNASISNSQRVNKATEAILSSSTTVGYATQPNGGDVYVGGAMNLCYSVAHELQYASGCTLGIKNSLAVAPKGFATTYTYSESFITETLIPSLRFIADNNSDSSSKYTNQIKVWQQVIANNNANKDRAEFVRNRSFDGNAGPITESTTSSSTQSSSLEFEVEVDRNLAISAGVEIGGSGFNGGVNIDLKMTTGNSSTNTNTSSTTMGYTLDDDDAGDYFSVDVKKDPVYNTPVFVLVAGTASCPAEPIAQSRDNVQLSIPTPEIRNIPGNGEALFQLHLQNTSESRETRTYFLTFNQSSNPNGALVTIGGSPVTSNISYTIPYLGSQTVTVAVRKSASSNIYSYEGLEFTLSDACEGGVGKSNTISAYFQSPCSDLILNAPVNNWIAKSSNNNMLPVEFTGYNLSNLQSVALEYAHAGRGDWRTDTTLYQNFISNPTSTILNWNIARIADGEYDIRMKLNCVSGSGYTQRLSGIIDREAPSLFGLPQPTDRSYVSGDEISMSYSENLQINNLNTNKVTMTRMLDGTDIPVQVSGYQNKVMIVPLININSFATGEAIRVVSKQIADIYGNESAVSDTFLFNVGASVATNSNRKVTLSNVVATKRAIFENSGDSLQIKFSVPTAAAYNTVVHYLVSGSAQFGSDYNNSFSSGQNLTTEFNGTQGTINIPANATSAILRIKPIADDNLEANETVKIRLLSGGDYKLGADSLIVITDTIKNDDLNQPEITLGDVPRTYPTGYCQTATDNSLAKPYVWNVPTTLPAGYCETLMDYTSIRPYVWNVPTTLPAGYCAIQMDNSLVKTNSTPTEVIPTTLPTGYCYADAPYNGDEQIFSVSFGSMNNVQSENCTTSYTDYSASIAPPTVHLNETVPFSVFTDECDGYWYYPSGMSIFIDYNRDGYFDETTEMAYTTNGTTTSPNTRSGNVVIPANATPGLTKMRVVVSESRPSPGSCGNMGYGEVEDYAVMIDASPAPSILADEQIFAVTFGTMSNYESDNCSSNYTDYTSSVAAPVVNVGETVPFYVLTHECDVAPYYASGMSVYIDYNRDGDFDDAYEQAYTTSETMMSPNWRSGNITIPTDAAQGLTKMRIIVAEGVVSPTSCINLGYGEVEDYSIMIHGTPTPQSINDDQQIFSVSFGSMNNVQSENCSTNYTDYGSTVTAPVVTTGTYVPFSVLTDECDAAPYYASGMSIFIDYNRDGDFDDAGEKAYTTNGTVISPNTRTGNIYIPTDATLGLTKMRVVVQEGDIAPASCISLGYGEVEDYAIMIHNVPPVQTVFEDEQIKAVSFGSMNNVQSDNCNTNYTDYSSSVTVPTVFFGESVPFSVLTDECDNAPYYASGMSIFIDYNRDGDFNDEGEKAYTSNELTVSPNTRSGEIQIPQNSLRGLTKMRVVVAEGVASPDACIPMGYGEVEDYGVMIMDGAAAKICQGGTAVLSANDQIDGQPVYSYVWKLGNNIIGTSRNITINAAGTYTLKVYTANGFSGASTPYVVTVTAPPTSDLYAVVCPSQLPYSWNGINYNTAGNFNRTISNAIGCDSIVNLHLTIKSNSYYVETISAIDTFEWHGTVYNLSTNAPVWTGTNAIGCDSIVNLHLTIIPRCLPIERIYNIIACNAYTWHGIRFTNSVSGVEWTTLNYRGCDSTEILNLTINRSSTSTTNVSICASQMPYLWNNTNYTIAGTYTKRFNNSVGCDSTAKLILVVNSLSSSITNVPICANEMPYTWNGTVYNTGGTYVKTFTNAAGCDSSATIVLTVKSVSNSNTNVSICSSQLPFVWNGLTLTATGTYSASFNNANGCDSLAILNLTIRQVSNVVETIDYIGVSYTWHGAVFTASNHSAAWTGINSAGCDSIVLLDLTLTNNCVPTQKTFNVTACNSYIWHGIRLTTSSTLEWVGVNAGGCDSIEILNLTINNLSPTASPSSITQTLVSNVCGARVYRYSATAVTNASGYNWTLPISVGGISGVNVDSGDVANSRIILVRYASTLAAFTTDSVKVKALSACGSTANRSAKLINTLFTVPAAPASITITPIVTNVCVGKRYRFTAPSLPIATTTTVAASGYQWVFTGVLGASIDSGDVNSKVITVIFSSSAAAATGDSVKLCYTSTCGNGLYKASKLANTLLATPAAPTVIVTAVQTTVCGARKYRYAASALPAASTTAAAATGWYWSLPAEGLVGITGTLDSGTVNSQVIVVSYTSNAAASAGDSIRVRFTSICGLGAEKATKLTNTVLGVPAVPTVTVTAVQTNVCSVRRYRYSASALSVATTTVGAASGWLWSLPEGPNGSTGSIDSGDVNSQTIVVSYTSNAAAVAGDTIRVRYTSGCGLGAEKATKLTNTLLGAPAAPASVTITLVSDICGARIYRYTVPALTAATTTTGAPSGYLWSMPFGTVGSTGVLDSGTVTSQVIRIRYSSNAVAASGDTIKVMYTSSCGNSPSKAQKLSNVAAIILAAPTTLTGTTSICSVVGTATSNRYIASAVTGALSYVWTLPTGAVLDSGSNGLKIKVRFLTAGANDSIYVQAVGTNGCYGTKKVLKLVTTGCVTPVFSRGETLPTTNTAIDPMSVSIYPNPTTSNYQLFVKTKNVSTVIARVFDAQGRLMNTFKFNSTETIAFGNELKAGVYMVELREGKEVRTVRVVKY